MEEGRGGSFSPLLLPCHFLFLLSSQLSRRTRAETLHRLSILNPFALGDFAEKLVLKLVEWFSGRCRAIKS